MIFHKKSKIFQDFLKFASLFGNSHLGFSGAAVGQGQQQGAAGDFPQNLPGALKAAYRRRLKLPLG
jgi:hypothetical protein